MASSFTFVVNLTDRNGNPMIGVEVEAIDVNLFTMANPDPMHYVIQTAFTDISGTARFTGLPIGNYYARPRITDRKDMRIQVQTPSGMGGGGKMCYAALVDPHPGVGTHTTIQSAINTVGIGGGVIYICAGTYTENVTIPVNTVGLWLIGASRGQCIIVGQVVTQAVLNNGVEDIRLEHLTLNGNGGVALQLLSAAGAMPTTINLFDLLITNASIGIDAQIATGCQDVKIKDVDMSATVASAGQFECTRMDISDCRWLVSAAGPYIGGGSAINDVKISNSTFKGGATYAMRALNVTKFLLTGCRLYTTGVGTTGLIIGNGADNAVADCHITVQEGKGIDASSAILVGLTLEGIQLESAVPQAADRIGIDIGANVQELDICGCRIKNFESYGIRLAATQNWVISETVVINGEDCHSIYLNGADYGTITGCFMRGTAGANTTYGVYGAAGTTYVVIVANTVRDHDGMTNLVNGVDGNVVGSNTGSGGGMGPAPHDPVTLDANADTLLSLTVQELGLDVQAANLVFSGPAAGAAAVPTFRSLVDLDIPAAIMRDAEHTAIGDVAPHHPAITLGGGSDPALSLAAGQVLTLADVLTPAEHTAIGDAAPHHVRYTDAEAIAAVEGEATLDLTGAVTITRDAGEVFVIRKVDLTKFFCVDSNNKWVQLINSAILRLFSGDYAGLTGQWDAATGLLQTDSISEITADAGVTIEGVKALDSFLEFTEIAKPADPAANKLRLYTKDKAGVSALYYLQDDGTEVEVGAGGAGGTPTLIEDADQDTKVQTEEGADEDKIRFDTAGVERMQIDENGYIGIGVAPSAQFGLLIQKVPVLDGNRAIANISTVGTEQAAANNITLDAVLGNAIIQNNAGFAGVRSRGLRFQAGLLVINANPKSIAEATGVSVQIYTGGNTGTPTIDLVRGLHVDIPFLVGNAGIFTTAVGLEISDLTSGLAGCTNVYGVRMANFTVGTNRYFLELGSTPYMRLLAPGSWNGVANETPLYLVEGAGPTLRQVRWKAGNALVAGDKVLVLV